jgi:hypothetical protein
MTSDKHTRFSKRALRTFRGSGSKIGEMQALGYLGEVAYRAGDPEVGLALLQQSVARAETLGALSWRGALLGFLVKHATAARRLDEAHAWARERPRASYDTGDVKDMVYTLANLARIAAEAGDSQRAARLWGIVELVEARGPVGGWEADREQYAVSLFATSDPELTRTQEEGRRMTLNDAVAYALSSSGFTGHGAP